MPLNNLTDTTMSAHDTAIHVHLPSIDPAHSPMSVKAIAAINIAEQALGGIAIGLYAESMESLVALWREVHDLHERSWKARAALTWVLTNRTAAQNGRGHTDADKEGITAAVKSVAALLEVGESTIWDDRAAYKALEAAQTCGIEPSLQDRSYYVMAGREKTTSAAVESLLAMDSAAAADPHYSAAKARRTMATQKVAALLDERASGSLVPAHGPLEGTRSADDNSTPPQAATVLYPLLLVEPVWTDDEGWLARMRLPVAEQAMPSAVLVLRVPPFYLKEAMSLLELWSFTYRTHFAVPADEIRPGPYLRQSHDLALLADRGGGLTALSSPRSLVLESDGLAATIRAMFGHLPLLHIT